MGTHVISHMTPVVGDRTNRNNLIGQGTVVKRPLQALDPLVIIQMDVS